MFNHIRFPNEEYIQRFRRTQNLMQEKGYDCLLLTDDRNTWYFSGFGDINPIGSKARPRILFLPVNGEPVFLVHESTEKTVREMVWFRDVRTYRHLTKGPVNEINSILSELESERTGAELGREQRINLNFTDICEIKTTNHLSDASELLWEVRAIKSELEIIRIEEACRITSLAYQNGFPKIREGMTELEIANILSSEMACEGADSSWIWVITSDYYRVDGVMRERKVQRGDLIFVDMGANISGYWADFSRTAIIGQPSVDQIDTYKKIVEVCAIGVELLKPGSHFKEVAESIHKSMADSGLEFNSKAGRYGHGLGMAVTEPPNIWDDERGIIKPGMVLTMEPGMFKDNGMFHIEENLVITGNGNRILSLVSRGLNVI